MKNKRFFAFGCSFTKYEWPTWADIIARDYDHFENWGLPGCGNHFIFNSLMECIQRNAINKDDTVMLCWSSITREDRYIKDRWLQAGNIFTTIEYPQSWVKQFITERGCLIRDLALIKAAELVLKQLGCKYKFFSIVPINYDMVDKSRTEHPDVIALYSDVLAQICPSYFEVIFDFEWTSRYSDFSRKMIESKNKDFKKRYNLCAGPDWPTFEDACNRNWYEKTNDPIHNEIKNIFPFDFFEVKRDYHPTPLEHLEYLQAVAPDIAIPDSTVAWLENYKLGDDFKFHSNRLRRL